MNFQYEYKNKPLNELVIEPINEPINEPTNDPINEPINEPTNEPTNEPINEPINEPTNEPINEPTNESINEPTNESINEPINESINEPINEPINEQEIELIKCNICYNKYTETGDNVIQYLSKCNHNICISCVKQLINDTTMTVLCPFCREISRISTNVINDTFVDGEQFVDFLTKITNPAEIINETCDKCNASTAYVGCIECEIKLCEKCWPDVHSIGKLVEHKKVSIEEYKTSPKCPTHPRYYRELVCTSNDDHNGDLICIICERTEQYKNLAMDLICNVTPQYRENLTSQLIDINNKIKKAFDTYIHLRTFTPENINKLTNDTIEQVSNNFKKMHVNLYNAETKCISDVKSLINKQTNELNEQKNNLYKYSIEGIKVSKRIDKSVKESEDFALMLNYDKYVKNLDNIKDTGINLNKTVIQKPKILWNSVDVDTLCSVKLD